MRLKISNQIRRQQWMVLALAVFAALFSLIPLDSAVYAESGTGAKKVIRNTDLPVPEITAWTRRSETTMLLRWEKLKKIDGYEIEVNRDAGFPSATAKRFRVKRKSTVKKISDLKENRTYYVRMRSYRNRKDGTVEVSKWKRFRDPGQNIDVKLSPVSKGGSQIVWNHYLPYYYRYKYVVQQGSTTDGTYNYYIFEPKQGNKCIILKVGAKSGRKVKVSKPLLLDHGNDITYNPDTKKLYVVHWDGHPYRVSVVDPKTLRITETRRIHIPRKLPGASAKRLRKIEGFASITYSKERKQYALRISTTSDWLLLDGDLKPVRYVRASRMRLERQQSYASDADHVYLCQDNSGHYNIITVYDWDGNYLYRILMRSRNEIQGIFKVNGIWYANYYRSVPTGGGRLRESRTYRISGM